MITLLYINIDKLPDNRFRDLLLNMPEQIQADVTRYKFMKDRKLKLLGRYLIQYYHYQNNLPFGFEDIKFGKNGKPYLESDLQFNISHSGKIVMVGFADFEIGVDIEINRGVGVDQAHIFFHPDEINWIKAQEHPKKAFLRLWTCKESYLKATGTGIVNNLQEINCLFDSIQDEGKWFLRDFEFLDNYHVAVCSGLNQIEYTLSEINPQLFPVS